MAHQILLRVAGQGEEVLAHRVGVHEAGHHLPELSQEAELPQHPAEHGGVEKLCVVGPQQHGPGEGAQEVQEGAESLGEGLRSHGRPVALQLAVDDREARHLPGAVRELELREHVSVEGPPVADRRQLDDVTHRGV